MCSVELVVVYTCAIYLFFIIANTRSLSNNILLKIFFRRYGFAYLKLFNVHVHSIGNSLAIEQKNFLFWFYKSYVFCLIVFSLSYLLSQIGTVKTHISYLWVWLSECDVFGVHSGAHSAQRRQLRQISHYQINVFYKRWQLRVVGLQVKTIFEQNKK